MTRRLFSDPEMNDYFETLPAYVKDTIVLSAGDISSLEELRELGTKLIED